MKKAYIVPTTMVFIVRLENMIATSIPKDSNEEIKDDNKDNFDFAPKADWAEDN